MATQPKETPQPKPAETPKPQPVTPTAPSQMFEEKAVATVGKDKLVKKRKLTVDVTNLQKLGELVCMAQSELYMKELPSQFHPSGKSPAYCVDIVDLTTGQELMLVCNAILSSALQKAGEPLSGRYFAMRCGEVVAGKRYRRVDVVELQRVE